jgi:hypothetical protein
MLRRLQFMVFGSCQPHASDINLLAYNDQALGGLDNNITPNDL